MANEVCRARSLQEVKKAPVCIKRMMSQNYCNDSINNLLFSVRVYVMDEYKWESRWKTQLAPSARHANFPVSFWAFDTLNRRWFRCKAELGRSQTSVRLFKGYCDREPICVNDEPETNLSRADYQLVPFVHS